MNFTSIIDKLTPNLGGLTPGLPSNLTVFDALPPEVVSNLQVLATILKAAGIIFIAYIIFLIIKGIWSFRRGIKISHMYHRINDIDRKIDILLARERLRVKERELMELKEEEKSFLKRLLSPRIKRRLVVMRREEKKNKEKTKKIKRKNK